MKELIYFISSYVMVFLINLFVYRKNKTYKDLSKQGDIAYLVHKFKLDTSKISFKTLKWISNIVNPLIISVTFVIVTNIDSLLWGLVVSLAIMLGLIYSIYEIIGRILKRRCEK